MDGNTSVTGLKQTNASKVHLSIYLCMSQWKWANTNSQMPIIAFNRNYDLWHGKREKKKQNKVCSYALFTENWHSHHKLILKCLPRITLLSNDCTKSEIKKEKQELQQKTERSFYLQNEHVQVNGDDSSVSIFQLLCGFTFSFHSMLCQTSHSINWIVYFRRITLLEEENNE